MAKAFVVKIVRFWGWLTLIFCVSIVILSIYGFFSTGFDAGFLLLAAFFAFFAAMSFLVTRYKKEKKANNAINTNDILSATIKESAKDLKEICRRKIEEIEENERLEREDDERFYSEVLKIKKAEKTVKSESPENAPPIEQPEPDEKRTKRKKPNKIAPGVEKSVFHIKYIDSQGIESSRDIEISSFTEENGKLSIYAYCYLRKEIRQFIADCIVSISIFDQPIENPQQFLWDNYQKQLLKQSQNSPPEA